MNSNLFTNGTKSWQNLKGITIDKYLPTDVEQEYTLVSYPITVQVGGSVAVPSSVTVNNIGDPDYVWSLNGLTLITPDSPKAAYSVSVQAKNISSFTGSTNDKYKFWLETDSFELGSVYTDYTSFSIIEDFIICGDCVNILSQSYEVNLKAKHLSGSRASPANFEVNVTILRLR